MEYGIFAIVLIASAIAVPSSSSKSYRPDYEYSRKTDAFYKLHIESRYIFLAKDVCKTEGASLMVPTSQDVAQLHGMLKRYPDVGEYVWVGDDQQHHESAEEKPIIDLTPSESDEVQIPWSNCEVVTRAGEIQSTECHHTHPFICKVDAKDAQQAYNEQCNVYGTGYKYFESVHSCYRVPPYPSTWDQAYAECRDEGSHLAVINSETERDVLKDYLNTVPKVLRARTTYFFFAGIRANRAVNGTERVFRTVFNQTLEEAGFSEWSTGEPNNYLDTEYCGTIFTNNGLYNDVNCLHEYGFICEKEVPPK